ncbi:MAG: hypothetical protein KIC78_11155, partial [Prevotella sp.]|uniref:hypothetical protein n=1 Tax=Prevotella sp. TaxID=59823 RepID=UPI00257EA172
MAEVANTNSAVLNMRLIINPVNILVFSISRNLVFIHSYIISADGFYIIVDGEFKQQVQIYSILFKKHSLGVENSSFFLGLLL